MVEEWRIKLDNDNIVGALLMDLSKAFDCIPHDLLIAKLHAYGMDENVLTLIYSYLKRQKQSVRINNTLLHEIKGVIKLRNLKLRRIKFRNFFNEIEFQ